MGEEFVGGGKGRNCHSNEVHVYDHREPAKADAIVHSKQLSVSPGPGVAPVLRVIAMP